MTAEAMLEFVRSRNGASVSDLSNELGVSEATVRRGLRRLAESGAIVRTYGGAVAAHTVADMRAIDRLDERQRIGRAAAALISDGETVVLGSGRTVLEAARHLTTRRDLTVITNALDVAAIVVDVPGIELIVLGGSARPGMRSLLGHLTQQAAAELRADRLIMGIPAFDAQHGLTSDHITEILTDRALHAIARQTILVADSSKHGRVEPAHVMPLRAVHTLVSDVGLPTEDAEIIEALGVSVIRA